MTANLSSLGDDLTPPSAEDRARLVEGLSDEARRILLNAGTEAPFCGGFVGHEEKGRYDCALCALPLFSSDAKFHSKSGWPSFYESVADDHVREIIDHSHGMVRTEIRCARCDSHLGHVFDDGPRPTGRRHCLNSVALVFKAQGEVG